MITKYYSEKLGKYFDTTDQCAAAELAWDKEHAEEEARKKERADAAKVIEDDIKELEAVRKKLHEHVVDFNKKFGPYRTSITTTDKEGRTSLWDLFNDFWF